MLGGGTHSSGRCQAVGVRPIGPAPHTPPLSLLKLLDARRSVRISWRSSGSVRSAPSRRTTTVGAPNHPRAVERGTWRWSGPQCVGQDPEPMVMRCCGRDVVVMRMIIGCWLTPLNSSRTMRGVRRLTPTRATKCKMSVGIAPLFVNDWRRPCSYPVVVATFLASRAARACVELLVSAARDYMISDILPTAGLSRVNNEAQIRGRNGRPLCFTFCTPDPEAGFLDVSPVVVNQEQVGTVGNVAVVQHRSAVRRDRETQLRNLVDPGEPCHKQPVAGFNMNTVESTPPSHPT